MYIPKTMINKIAKTFYDKEVSILEQEISIDAEGGVNVKGYEIKNAFKGNVNFANCKQIQENYGLEYVIDITITTDYKDIQIGNIIKYQDVVYKVSDVINNDSHVLVVATKWRQ